MTGVKNGKVKIDPKTGHVRERWPLQDKYFDVCDEWLNDKEAGLEVGPLTAAEIANRTEVKLRTIGDMRTVSIGTVSSTLERWCEQGVAKIAYNPIQFIDYTDKVYETSITEVKRNHRIAAIEEGKRY